MRELRIRNWDELQSVVFENVWEPSIMRYRNSRVYRGMADCEWALTPTLNRSCAHDLSLEKMIVRSFVKYGYAELQGCNSFWELIAMGQQFGLPTRLLDWTYSPLVAAHFATEDVSQYDRDGVIWCVDTNDVNKELPTPLKTRLEEQKGNIFARDILEEVAHDFKALQSISETPFALFFEPASTVNRIANQYALFSVVSDPKVTLLDLPVSDTFTKLVIDRHAKLEIRDKLDYINISERMIYPGLDGICKWIARRYAPLGPIYNSKNECGEHTER